MAYTYHEAHSVFAWRVNKLLIACGWPSRAITDIQRSWKMSLWAMVAWAREDPVERSSPRPYLVGMARLVGDGIYTAVLFDVIVHPDHRHRGIGRRLVEMAVDYGKELGVAEIECCAAPGASGFYEALGWEHKDAFAWKFGEDTDG